MTETKEFWMREALRAAMDAREIGEVPIGACIVDAEDKLISTAFNETIIRNDPTAHAEILAIRLAGEKIGNYRLSKMILFTTIEPCAMCAGALVNARIKQLVFGAHDERFGAVESNFRICDSPDLNHRLEITSGILADECRHIMQDFFRARRPEAR